MVGEIPSGKKAVYLAGLRDVGELLDRRVGRLPRLPSQQIDVSAVLAFAAPREVWGRVQATCPDLLA